MATTPEFHAPKLGQPGECCWTCGAPLADDQRYCLNCGERRTDPRLPFDQLFGDAPQSAAAPQEPEQRGPTGLRVTPLTAGVAAGLLLLSVLLGVVIGNSGQKDVTIPAQKAPVVNVTGGAPAAAGTAAAVEFTSDWPGEDGWTVQLQVLPKDGTDAAAVAAAKQTATTTGATEVGALDSDEYPSLEPGNYVIYAGVFTSKKEATAALKGLKTSFPDAKVVEVSTSETTPVEDTPAAKDSGGSSDTAKTAKKIEKLSGDKYVEETQKAKDDSDVLGPPPGESESTDEGASSNETTAADDTAGGAK